MQIRLLDFNPIGGATSPLLYTWEELGYHVDSPSDQHDSDQPQSASAEPHLAQLQVQSAIEDCKPHASSSGSSSGPAPRQNEGMHDTGFRGTNRQADSAAAQSGYTRQHAGHAVSVEAVTGNGHGNGCSAEQEILVRFAEPGRSMLRPASALYGAPYDMADLSEGSAISEMLRKMQTQEHEEPQVQDQEDREETS